MSWKNRFNAAGVPKRHKDFRTTDNSSPEWMTSYEKARQLMASGTLSALTGKRGVGKTQAGVCLIGLCCQNLQETALYTKALDVFLSIRNGNNPNSGTTEKKEIQKYISPHLLVIDAYEVRGDTAFENRIMDHIIDKRYDAEKPTVLITNDTAESLVASLGKSNIDRLREGGGIIQFEGDSFRAAGRSVQ